jgi:hypothetical protein
LESETDPEKQAKFALQAMKPHLKELKSVCLFALNNSKKFLLLVCYELAVTQGKKLIPAVERKTFFTNVGEPPIMMCLANECRTRGFLHNNTLIRGVRAENIKKRT